VLCSSQDHLRTGTQDLDHPVFLHAGGSAGPVVHFDVSRERNVDALFFILRWDRYGFHKKLIATHYAELVFLHPVGSVGHVVHPVRPGRETSIYYFSYSDGTSTDSTKSTSGHIMSNLCFLHPVGLRDT
jgi:hypothetical protein